MHLKINLVLFALGLTAGFVAGLVASVYLPIHQATPSTIATPTNCFRTANYQDGQIVSYSYKCVPITPMP